MEKEWAKRTWGQTREPTLSKNLATLENTVNSVRVLLFLGLWFAFSMKLKFTSQIFLHIYKLSNLQNKGTVPFKKSFPAKYNSQYHSSSAPFQKDWDGVLER